jgi:hypothetical protein
VALTIIIRDCRFPIVKPRNSLATAALITAFVAALAVVLSVDLAMASHAMTSGCFVDRSLQSLGLLSTAVAGLLSVAAAALGLSSLMKSNRASGAYFGLGVAAVVIGVIILAFCFLWFVMTSGTHAVNPAYLHPC